MWNESMRDELQGCCEKWMSILQSASPSRMQLLIGAVGGELFVSLTAQASMFNSWHVQTGAQSSAELVLTSQSL